MATSSLDKNFVIKGSKQAEMFVEALEKAEKASKKRKRYIAKKPVNDTPSINFMENWEKFHGTNSK